MRVAYLSSEVAPFAKTGGLADVAGSLPVALRHVGNDVAVFTPLYRCVDRQGSGLEPMPQQIEVRLDSRAQTAGFWSGRLPGSDVPIYCVANDAYFDREGLYQDGGDDYPDNLERFTFFCRAVLKLLQALDWRPDILHCNDWQTAPAVIYAKSIYRDRPAFTRTRTLLTVHNMAYHGSFPAEQFRLTGLPDRLFGIDGLEFYGKVNLLKGGLVFADHINTVSKQYAKEICTAEFGHGLDGVLRQRAEDLSGILNGVDYSAWDPRHDPLIEAPYGPDSLEPKAANKAALQRAFGLAESADTPLIGMICRLDRQKGMDLLLKAFPRLAALELQLVLLGTGDPRLHEKLEALAARHPARLGVRLAFDNRLAHLIEAGSDLFLMPSLFEPCGLNQMYSLRYGTIPVVRKTGGLADTVQNYSPRTGKGNGFVFSKPRPGELVQAVRRAVELYRGEPDAWHALVRRAMQLDFSWDASARAYDQLYRRLQRNG